MAITPLAPPLRSRGALAIRAFRLGDWKKPKPAPQMHMRRPISSALGLSGNSASDTMPALSTASPTPPSRPGG
ncbi:hypothetical protein D3C81_2034930 [compost metagenome]